MSVLRSVLGDLTVPEVSLQSALFQKFVQHGLNVAMVNGISGKTYTFNELVNLSHKVASGLAKLGLKKGEVVSMFSYNTLEWVLMFWGVVCAGGTVTTADSAYTKYELATHLKNYGAKFLYTISPMLPVSKQACKEATSVHGVKKIICVNSTDLDCIPFSQLSNDNGSLWRELENISFEPKDDVVVIPYSSGTTGLPKGVLLTHYNVIANLMQLGHPAITNLEGNFVTDRLREGPQETILIVLPMYHNAGMIWLMMLYLAKGSRCIILPRFEPRSFLQAIEKYKVSYLHLVPSLVIFMAKSPLVREYDLSSLVTIGSGAAPLSAGIEKEIIKKLNISDMRQGYGMTETTCVACWHSISKPIKRGSCGNLLPGCEAKVVDVTIGTVLGPNQRGELLMRGPNIMKGYLNNKTATRETIDADGFVHSGDIAYYDSDGYFYIVDRIKELIKVKGHQVAPAELEAILLNHPKVADAGVTGIADERAGELPRAFVVKKPDLILTEMDIQEYVAERTAAFKHLKGGVQFIDSIPRLTNGKIVRRKLKELPIGSKL